MARQLGWALAALIVVGSGAPGAAFQEEQQKPQAQPATERREGHDRGPWWKAPKTVAELKLTPEQSAAIDAIFHQEIDKAKPLREELQQLEQALDRTMKANTAEVAVVAQQVDRIENMRAQLNKMRTLMLYRMRRLLNAEQNAKFQTMLDQREAERRKNDGDRRR
jgi:Spy/CpxP family protein refolding chaperone